MAVGSWQDIVVFVHICDRGDATVVQSGDTCIDDIHRTRLDSTAETGQSALYENPIVTECEILRFVSGPHN